MDLNESLQRMRVLSGLTEINVKPKGNLGQGRHHTVWPTKDPGKVIKTGWDWVRDAEGEVVGDERQQVDLLPGHIEVLLRFPEIFPTVYKHNARYAVIETLDVDRVHQEQEQIREQLKQAGEEELALGGLEALYIGDVASGPSFREQLLPVLPQPELVQKYLTFFDLVNAKLTHDIIGNHFVDVNADNMGYDSHGVLKLLDF